MRKKILLLLAIIITTSGLGVAGKIYFSANIFSPEVEENKAIETKKMFINAIDAQQNCDCSAINTDGNNQYLEEGTNEDGGYHPDKSIALFLQEQDEAYKERMEDLQGSKDCSLNSPTSKTATDEMRLGLPIEFKTQRWEDFQKIDCALQVMRDSNNMYCEDDGVRLKYEAFVCDEEYRKLQIDNERRELGMATEIAMMQADEMASVYGLHEKINCAIEGMEKQRDLMVDFATEFAKLPGAYINSTSAK